MKVSGALRDVEEREKDEGKKVKELKAELSRLAAKHTKEVDKLQTEFEEKVIFESVFLHEWLHCSSSHFVPHSIDIHVFCVLFCKN